MAHIRGAMIPGISVDGLAEPAVIWSILWNIRLFYLDFLSYLSSRRLTSVSAQVPLSLYSVLFPLASFFLYFPTSFHS